MLPALLALTLLGCSTERTSAPAWPGLIVEDWTTSLIDNTAPYPGVSYYIPKWSATAMDVAQLHARGWKVMGVYQLPDPRNEISFTLTQALLMFGQAGYDSVVLDEPVQRYSTQLQINTSLASGSVSDLILDARVTQRAAYPQLQVGVVEPFAPNLRQLLALRTPLDFVAGEDYGGQTDGWPDKVHLSDLASFKNWYGVDTQMWIVGADQVLAAYGNVDQVVAIDVHGSWGTSRVGPYDKVLRLKLAQNYRTYLPMIGDRR